MLHWRAPLQFAAQGSVLCILALQFNLPFISWIGILCILIGLILTCSKLFSEDNSGVAKTSNTDDMFSDYPFPACVSDKNGSLISISQGFTQLIGRNVDNILQMNINGLMPTNGIIQLGGKFLQVIKQESKDKLWYTLKEGIISQQSADPSLLNSGTFIHDSETKIFSKEFCRIRTEEEVVRIKRYKRWAVFMLIRINFKNAEENSISKQSESAFFSSFCLYVKNTLRNCDTVARVDEFSVFVILPETLSEEPVNEVIKKILNFSSQLSNTISQLKCTISPGISHFFYNASSKDMSFNDILLTLNNTFSEYDYT
jgi:GGDEF domain-containing protein